jgi:hypothetical protein
MFTDGQVARMHAALEFSRPDLGLTSADPDDVPAPRARRKRTAARPQ